MLYTLVFVDSCRGNSCWLILIKIARNKLCELTWLTLVSGLPYQMSELELLLLFITALWVLSFLSPKTSDDQYTCDFQKRDYSRYSFCVFNYFWHNKHWKNSWREDFVNGKELPPENWAGVMIRTLKTLAFTLILKSGFGVCTSHLIWRSSLFQGDWLCTQQLKSVKMNQLTQLPMTAKIA